MPGHRRRHNAQPARSFGNRDNLVSVGWLPSSGDPLTFEEWVQSGRRLGSAGRGSSWWIGDWINYGNARFGEKYTRAAHITGYDTQSLMNMAYVASRFEHERRRPDLTWSHHAEVAPLAVPEQDNHLRTAAEEGLSVRSLRERIRIERQRERATEASPHRQLSDGATSGNSTPAVTSNEPPASDNDDLICPACGFSWGSEQCSQPPRSGE